MPRQRLLSQVSDQQIRPYPRQYGVTAHDVAICTLQVTASTFAQVHRRFVGTNCLHLHVRTESQASEPANVTSRALLSDCTASHSEDECALRPAVGTSALTHLNQAARITALARPSLCIPPASSRLLKGSVWAPCTDTNSGACSGVCGVCGVC
jgi:hypothetical protein